jgi:hypothetical protein
MNLLGRPKHASSQRGQTILWFLATTAACCAVFALVYNMGQVTNEKEKTINAADASALSGALVEARMLNFEAYTNRAIVANEELIAQLASLDSWIRYGNRLADGLALLTVWIPYVDEFTVEFAEGMQELAMYADEITQTGIKLDDTVLITYLTWAREIANGVAVLAAQDVAKRVAAANQTTFGNRFDAAPELVGGTLGAIGWYARNEYAWNAFTRRYMGNDRGNAAQVILNSRDQFTTHRGTGWLIDAINKALSLLSAIGIGVGLDKTSGDTILQGYDRWEAQDTLDLWTAIKFFGITVGKKYVLPIAWGRDNVDAQGSMGYNWTYGHGPCKARYKWGACTLAYYDSLRSPDWSGIPALRDLSNPRQANGDAVLTYVVGVQKSGSATMTTQRLGSGMNNVHVDGPQGSPDLKDNLQNGDRLTSLAAARVFFTRPDWNPKDRTEGKLPRPDHVREYASLYNPYWQARLAQVSTGDRTLFYALLGKPGLNAFTP